LQETTFPGLTVLTSGAIPPNPSELLASLATKKILSELRSDFDYVVVDSSPLLPVTDGAILAASADGVLILARFGETKREQLTRAVGNLLNVEARIVGAILTMVPAKANASHNYGYYGDAGSSPAVTSRHRERRSRRDRQ
jgi:receptor protein-tyrosine kinase